MIIAVDFDGTVVTHEYPKIGKDVGAAPVLKKLVEKGHKLILYTMRSGKELDEAVEWFKERNIPLYGVNENPSQSSWTSSPKVYANLYIDDATLGAYLITPQKEGERPYINWLFVVFKFREKGIFGQTDIEEIVEERGKLNY